MDEAVTIRLANGEHFVIARNQPYLDAAAWIRTRKRVYKDIDAIVRGVGCKTQVGHDEPLCCLLSVIIRDNIFWLGGYGVDAGAEILDRQGRAEKQSSPRC
jgi:hypothetical protein